MTLLPLVPDHMWWPDGEWYQEKIEENNVCGYQAYTQELGD